MKRGPRGRSIPEVRWWLRLARELVANDERDGGLIQLGKELSKASGRLRPWSHSALSNFAHGKAAPTIELTEALGVFFGLPSPVYFARSIPEALELAKVKAKYDTMRIDESDEDAQIVEFTKKRKPPRSAHEPERVSVKNAK